MINFYDFEMILEGKEYNKCSCKCKACKFNFCKNCSCKDCKCEGCKCKSALLNKNSNSVKDKFAKKDNTKDKSYSKNKISNVNKNNDAKDLKNNKKFNK